MPHRLKIKIVLYDECDILQIASELLYISNAQDTHRIAKRSTIV